MYSAEAWSHKRDTDTVISLLKEVEVTVKVEVVVFQSVKKNLSLPPSSLASSSSVADKLPASVSETLGLKSPELLLMSKMTLRRFRPEQAVEAVAGERKRELVFLSFVSPNFGHQPTLQWLRFTQLK